MPSELLPDHTYLLLGVDEILNNGPLNDPNFVIPGKSLAIQHYFVWRRTINSTASRPTILSIRAENAEV
jgi:hypothetical protein